MIMKKYLTSLLLLLFISQAFAQTNLFPSSGSVGIGTTSPAGQLQIIGNSGWDTATKLHLTNGSTDYGRTNFILTGRMQAGNDSWQFGSDARNSIVFAGNSASSGQNVGGIGTEQFSIQHEMISNSLGFLSQTKATTPVLVMRQSGNVGIGTVDPQEKLHVANGKIMASHPNYHGINVRMEADNVPVIRFSRDGDGNHVTYQNAFIGQFYNQHLGSYSLGIGTGSSANGNADANTTVITIPLSGNVGIGTTTPDHKLTVDGAVKCEEVKVEIFAGTGPDYVFEKDYALTPLGELEAYINQNKHLPEIPSAKEMEAEGLNLKEMNLLLLKKVEELTLHVIHLNKNNSEMRSEIEKLKNK
jgi:hypothetical protein